MTTISIGIVTGITDSTTSAKIRVGIDMIRSTARDRSWSAQPPRTAARKPRTDPVVKLSTVAAVAMKIVVRPP